MKFADKKLELSMAGLLLLSMLWVVTCNGPETPQLLYSRMNANNHETDPFPIGHGSSENSNQDCDVCHGGFDSFSEFTCVGCHFHEETTADAQHEGVSTYAYESESCYSCHPDGETFSREAHAVYFPIADGTKHQSAECEQCHTGSSYEDFSCLDCHEHAQETMDPAHDSVSGYVYESSSCLACHPDGTVMDRDEHDDFPISSGTAHESVDCSGCHNGSSYSEYTCTDCHSHEQTETDADHSGVSGYDYESSSCLSCHPDGTVMDRDDHDDFPISSGSAHQSEDCSGCHNGSSYSEYTCTDCHSHEQTESDSDHSNVSGYAYESSSCLSCHPDGFAITREQHNSYFPITSGDHSRYDCEDCHQDSGTYQTFTCIGCHDGTHTCSRMNSEHSEEGVKNYSCEDEKCLSCHPDGRD